jgi:hypothetical protein
MRLAVAACRTSGNVELFAREIAPAGTIVGARRRPRRRSAAPARVLKRFRRFLLARQRGANPHRRRRRAQCGRVCRWGHRAESETRSPSASQQASGRFARMASVPLIAVAWARSGGQGRPLQRRRHRAPRP